VEGIRGAVSTHDALLVADLQQRADVIFGSSAYQEISRRLREKPHIGFGFVGRIFDQNIDWVVPATLAVMGGYVAGATIAAEFGTEVAAGDLAAEFAAPEIIEVAAPEIIEYAAPEIVEEIAFDTVTEQLAVESLPEVIQQAATMPDYFPAVELPAPSSIPGAVNWGQLATKAVGFGSSLYQQQQAKQAAADQASARKRPLPGAALQMSGFPLILIAAAGAVTLMLLTTQGKRRHVSRSTR
jgi:hypothetical protein